jgi:hypothetical protein
MAGILKATKIRCPRCGDPDVFIETVDDDSSKITCPACHWSISFERAKTHGEVMKRYQRGMTRKGHYYQYLWTREKI